MALQMKQPGTNIIGAFTRGLADAPHLGEEFLPQSGYHIPAYVIRLKDLNNLEAANSIDGIAKQVAWQCLAISANAPDERAVVGEVTPLNKAQRLAGDAGDGPAITTLFSGPVRMTSLSHGEIVDRAYKNIHELNKRQDQILADYNIQGDHEPRMLRITGLLITAVWLKANTKDAEDWIVPLHTKIADLQTKAVYSMEEFIRITKPLARERLESTIFD